MTEREKALEAALLPCPFCGDLAHNDEATAHIMGTRTSHDFAVACSNCEVSAPGASTVAQAVTNWNTRADAALAMPATVDRASWEAGRDAAAAAVMSAQRGYHDGISGDWHPYSVREFQLFARNTIQLLTPPAPKDAP